MMMQASTIVAICAFFVSVLSLGTSIYFSWCARDHNRRTVKPLPFILQRDYEDQIAVVIRNNGTGPMILRKAEAKNATDGRSGHLIDLVPDPPDGLAFSNFNKVQQIRAIRPGDEVDLIDLPITNEPAIIKYRDELRRILGNMTIELTYTDVYDTHFPIYAVKMGWFLRHLNDDPA
jgi:hypothetical protein